ncbi:hypothetical protein HGA34_03945 [Candidatus Falkowbacteria bacterium]|nr:hypothetical protein [Candidatus Falkowbacteria bacterium]
MRKIFLIFPLFALILTGCGAVDKNEAAKPAVPVEVPKPVAVVFAPSDFDEATLAKVEQQLNQRNVPYEAITIQIGKFTGPQGRVVEVKKATWEVKPEDFRAVIYIGGPGMANIAKDDTLVFMAQKFAKAGKKLVAFGEGNDVLSNAGLPGGDTGAPAEPASASSDDEVGQIVESLSE